LVTSSWRFSHGQDNDAGMHDEQEASNVASILEQGYQILIGQELGSSSMLTTLLPVNGQNET
jgi:hypothetical protein